MSNFMHHRRVLLSMIRDRVLDYEDVAYSLLSIVTDKDIEDLLVTDGFGEFLTAYEDALEKHLKDEHEARLVIAKENCYHI